MSPLSLIEQGFEAEEIPQSFFVIELREESLQPESFPTCRSDDSVTPSRAPSCRTCILFQDLT